MNHDPLLQGFVDRILKDCIHMRKANHNECKAIERVIILIHEKLEVPEDIRPKILAFIYNYEDSLMLFLKKVTESLLYRDIHL
jgi:hypothetical protein